MSAVQLATMPAPEANTVTLGAADRRLLEQASERLLRYDVVAQTEAFVLEAQLLSARLSDPLLRTLIAFRRFGDPSGGLLLRGVPIGVVPPTPERADDAVGVTLGAAGAMSVLLACLGDQYGFRPELGGNLVQDILPVRGFETDQISLGSTVDLKTHVEMAFSEFRSDYVALLCLRQDHDRRAGTTLSSAGAMLALLDPAIVEILRAPRFKTTVDRSFLIGDGRTEDVWVDRIRVLEGSPKRPRLRVDFAETVGRDDEAQEALDALADAAARTQLVVRLEPGDLLVADNNVALHGRTPFVPRYDGMDRWLLRSFVTRDLRRSAPVRPTDERIVESDYGQAS